ncbi:MAG: hypothetical protein LLF81_03610 [Porphyromonadaceae bacterium]|nr:hypothetical protein [Porphyromonadaceae bacterium]
MAKTFSLDLGTASIGYTIRNTDNGSELIEQLDNFGSIIFKKGVGNSQTGEFSYAAERTKHRSSRRLYQVRRYRIWETLRVLIEYGFCPLSMEHLDKWRKYDKEKGLKRQYPIDALEFEQWVRLDFDGDDKPDYSSPYQLRSELATTQLDFTKEINKYKLGRALYHIAQRRGFKSSKGETLKEQEDVIKDISNPIELDITTLKKSEGIRSKDLMTYMSEHNMKTVGCALAKLENEGVRVRASIYQAVRSQYKEEVKYIFGFQNGLDINSDFFHKIYSDRKDGSIFYKRPLRSQKGLVGKCTLEPIKPRCPISHPEFEKFRAFSFINNIQYRSYTNDEWKDLTVEQKIKLYDERFLLTRSNFKFEEIRQWLEKEIGKPLSKEQKACDSTINYSDKTNVAGCPVTGRLKNLLGDDWRNFEYITSEKRKDKNGKEHTIVYSMEDIWHICFSFDDEELVTEFAKTKLNYNDKQIKSFVNLWIAIPQGYSLLSLKAIRNINQFLEPKAENELYKGFIYTESALLGKIPEILGEDIWKENEKDILRSISSLINENREEKRILNIVNNLISAYKSLEHEEQFAYKNNEYQLDELDLKDIEMYTRDSFGENSWEKETQENKNKILEQVADKYQQFFSTSRRDYFHLPKSGETLKTYLSNNFQTLHCDNNFVNPQNEDLPCRCDACKKLNKLYHPSMVEFYKPAKTDKDVGLKLLESPVIGAFKNPMAMRTLHQLRKLVNHFINEGIIDEETRIVVETARDLNDANMRWAIDKYQREREIENKEIAKAIKELRGEERNDDDIDKARLLIDQNPDYLFDKVRYDAEKEEEDSGNKKKKKFIGKTKDFQYKKDITKYKLWLEQGMECLYTGKIINISNLFDENATDFEHTIPRSQTFDNSLANLTICDYYYNRHIKKNRIPTQLENYDKEVVINGQSYSAIKPRLEKWEQKVEQLKNNVEFWRYKSKQAQTKENKDDAIRQKNVWQMELDYWRDKLSRFTMTEVTSGFKHSQLNDTRLITKYAYHYLKSVFNKVEVQKGSVTADFRKMLGVQSVEEKKSRDKHSHHAIDAAVLSLIPVAAKRDKMLELFYKIQEENKLNRNTDVLEQELQKEIRTCQIKNVSNLAQYIEENILINHIAKDQTLTPAKRKARKRGKVIGIKDENGKYLLDDKGEKIPKYWIKGDCIRGQLHGDTFYGAITQGKKDENGCLLRDENGKIISDEQIFYVVRRELKFKKNDQDKGFKTLDELKISIVDKSLFEIIEKQCEGKTFKDACEEGFWMIDKKGNRVNRIRHIRCYTSIKNPLSIKKQTYLSDKEYKQTYYSENAENTLYALYWDGKNKEKGFECRNLFDVALILKTNNPKTVNDFFEPNKQIGRGRNKIDIPLYAILKPETKVIFFGKDKEELKELSNNELSKRIYKMNRIFSSEDGRIQFYHHLDARDDKKLLADFPEKTIWFDGKPTGKRQKNGFAKFSPDFVAPRLLLAPSNFNFIIEGKDFEMNLDGTMTFKY